MTTDIEKLSETVLRLTEAVGSGEMGAEDALVCLEAGISECFDLREIKAIWPVLCMGTEVLAHLVPGGNVLVMLSGKSSTPDGEEPIPPEVLTQIMIREIMRDLERRYPGGTRGAGASRLLAVCPNPIPRLDTPFDDSKKLAWDRTQRQFVIR